MNIEACRLIQLPHLLDERGCLGIVEGNQHIPFPIQRLFYLHNIPAMKTRGAHAHKTLQQFIISFGDGLEVEIDTGKEKKLFHLNSPSQGLYIPPMIWTTVKNFSQNSICLVLASDIYIEADYYRDYQDFLAAVQHG